MYQLYRHLSPYLKLIAKNLGLLDGRCRFTPTCSRYVKEAYVKHHFFLASWLTIKRVLKCHPWSKGGYDPVP